VGLCQWGTYFMAKEGYKYDEILKYYYPGAEITQFN
jgi:stage II sporulation protein D